MFTGLIEEIGKVVKYDDNRLWLSADLGPLRIGESICVEGVCLTVSSKAKNRFCFDVGPETKRITTLGKLARGFSVNLERALRIGDRLGGHWVTGHVEDTGSICEIASEGSSRWYTISFPQTLRRYFVPKGSLAVDGISLTIVSVKGRRVKVMIVPHTLRNTTLPMKKVGDLVNLEPDILAKYARGPVR